jgi:hypothetical protein
MSFVAVGVTAGVSVLGGAAQAIIGGGKERRAERALENLKTPTYTESPSIKDYYMQALQRYNVNPYQSTQYQQSVNQANKGVATGLNTFQNSKDALAGVGGLVAGANNAVQQAGVNAENSQNQRFNQLGSAAEAQAQQDQTAFQYNQLAPYQKQLQILGMQGAGGAQMLNQGLSNIFSGLGSAGNAYSAYSLNQPKYGAQQTVTANQLGYQ